MTDAIGGRRIEHAGRTQSTHRSLAPANRSFEASHTHGSPGGSRKNRQSVEAAEAVGGFAAPDAVFGGALPRQVAEHRRTGGGSGAGRREMSPNTFPRRVLGRITAPGAVALTPTLRGLVVGATPAASSDVSVAPCLKNPSLGQLSRQTRLLTSFAIYCAPLRLILFSARRDAEPDSPHGGFPLRQRAGSRDPR
jgi:hypothetical protein